MMNYPASYHKPFPEIDLGDFYLREKQESDVADFFSYYSDPEVNRFILCEIPRDLEEARKELLYWRNIFYQNDGIYFAIASKENGRMIGSIGLTGFNAYQARIEISYDLDRKYWNRGIMTSAVKALVEYSFGNLHCGKINRLEAFVSTDNLASQRLLLKCGFLFEGVLRQHRYHRGRYVDVCSFSLLRQDIAKDFNEDFDL